MGFDITSFEAGEDIVLSVKRADIRKVVNGKQNINVKIYSGIVPKVIVPKSLRKTVNNGCNKQLTMREKDVLKCLIQGMSNVHIAKKLCVSRYTIKAHVANILQKLEVSDRFEAAIKAITENIV